MIAFDEDALICDLAETYQIFDYRSLPVQLVATLSAGLRDDSRIKLLLAGSEVSMDTLILASIADNLALLRSGFSREGGQKPVLFTELLNKDAKKQAVGFDTSSEFEAALARIRGN